MNATRYAQSRSGQSRSFDIRKKTKLIAGIVIGLAGLASWIFIFSQISFAPALAITDVRVFGAESDVIPRIRGAAYRSLQGAYLGIFSKANVALYPKGDVQSAVAAASTRISGIQVKRTGLHSLAITVTEKTPSAAVCVSLPNFDDDGGLVAEAPQNSCFYTDESGLMFRKVNGSVADSFNRYYIPSAPDDPLGHFATSTDTFQALQGLTRDVRKTGIVPEAILVKAAGEYELYIKNRGRGTFLASSTAIVYFNDDSSFSSQLANLQAFWNTMKKKDFEYIDVRYGSNVFYRLIQ